MHFARALIVLTFITSSATAAPPPRPELDLSAMPDLPPEVIAVGAVQSLALFERDLASFGMAQAAQVLFASDYASAVDMDAPVRAALIDPNKYGVGVAVVVELQKGSAMLKRITAKNWERVLDPNHPTPTYIDSIGGNRVVVTQHPQMFQMHTPFFKKLAAWKPKAPYMLDGHVGNAASLYHDMIQGFLSDADSADVRTMIEGLARISIAFELGSDYPRLTVGMTAIRGSEFEREFALYDGSPADKLLDEVPADAWFIAATSLPKGLIDDVDEAVATLAALLPSDQRSAAPNAPQDAMQLRSLLETIARLTKGRHVMWSVPRDNVTLNWLIDAQDAGTLHAATIDLLEFGLLQGLRAAAGKQAPKTAAEAIQVMAAGARQKGMQLVLTDNYAAPRTSMIAATLDWAMMLGQAKNSQSVDYARRVVGDVWSWGLSSNGKRTAIVFSPDAASEAPRVAAGPPASSFRNDPWARDASRNESFVYMRLDALARYLPSTDRDGRKLAAALELMAEPVVATSRVDKAKGKLGMSSRMDFTLPRSIFTAIVQAY